MALKIEVYVPDTAFVGDRRDVNATLRIRG
jgi:hypothetical protein